MIKKSFNKLIRDKVADNLAAKNISTVTKRLSDAEMPIALAEKLKEELMEFHNAHPHQKLEEAIDILTVTRAWLVRYGSSETQKVTTPPFTGNGQIVEELEERIMNIGLLTDEARGDGLVLIVKLIKFWALDQGYTEADLERAYKKKLNSHGGFKMNVFLYETIESETKPRIN